MSDPAWIKGDSPIMHVGGSFPPPRVHFEWIFHVCVLWCCSENWAFVLTF